MLKFVGRAHAATPLAALSLSAMLLLPCEAPAQVSLPVLPLPSPSLPLPLPGLGSLIVTLSSPTSGSTVSGTVQVSASVSIVGSLTVAGVGFRVDGANIGAEDTAAPYSVSWNTTATSNGSHTLRAVARDILGVSWTSDPVTVTVSNGPPPDTTRPTVDITSPASGASVSGTIDVTANASDNVGVVGVQFQRDGVNLGAEDTTAPYSVSWDTTTSGDGSHTLTARARDAAGNTTTSSGVTVTVSNGGGSVTRSEEDAASYAGTGWTVRGSEVAAFSGGTARSSNVAGNSSTFTFTGTAVSWIGLRCNICGIASVSIDGGAPTSIDTAGAAAAGSPGLTSEVVFTSPPLAAGTHSLVITVSGDTTSSDAHIVVDAFDVTGGTATGSDVTRVEDNDAAVSYTGTWVRNGSDPRASGGTFSESNTAGAQLTLSFTGTEVRWLGYRYDGAGIARVVLDGNFVGEVDLYSASPELTAVFRVSGLPRGAHTLSIEVTGTHNAAASDSWVVVDGFDVTK